MTPKEKANDLFDKMHWSMPHPSTTNAETYIISKMCAIVAVDEILNAYPHTFGLNKEYTKDGELVTSIVNIRPNIIYWQKVKQEIENL
jgi:hypothetical protein